MESICKLCQEEQELINSHIIPKFLHKKILPEQLKDQMNLTIS